MARKSESTPSREILEAALAGLELQRNRIDEQIEQVQSLIGRRPGRPPKSAQSATTTSPTKKTTKKAASSGKRTMSPEARKRIAAAQKKRWAAYHKAQG